MWLLDANMDVHLAPLLRGLGAPADTAANRDWKALANGDLVAAAAECGFTCLLTRDRLFAESARTALARFDRFAVVLVGIPQQPWHRYRESFTRAWSHAPIVPKAGRVVCWPEPGES